MWVDRTVRGSNRKWAAIRGSLKPGSCLAIAMRSLIVAGLAGHGWLIDGLAVMMLVAGLAGRGLVSAPPLQAWREVGRGGGVYLGQL